MRSEYGYYSVAFEKWKFFLYATISFLAVMLAFGVVNVAHSRGSAVKTTFSGGLLSDKAVGLYLLLSIVTFCTCENRLAAWMGTEGWYMDLICCGFMTECRMRLSGIICPRWETEPGLRDMCVQHFRWEYIFFWKSCEKRALLVSGVYVFLSFCCLATIATGYFLWRQRNGKEIPGQRAVAVRWCVLVLTAVAVVGCISLIVLFKRCIFSLDFPLYST